MDILKQNNLKSNKEFFYEDEFITMETNQNKKMYLAMCKYPDKLFNLDDIAIILKQGTNPSSRVFSALRDNNLIELIGSYDGESGKLTGHYKVIDPKKPFYIKKKIQLTKEVNNIKKDIIEIIVYCINPANEYSRKEDILKMAHDIIKKVGQGEEVEKVEIRNRFDKEYKHINALEFIEKILKFFKKDI